MLCDWIVYFFDIWYYYFDYYDCSICVGLVCVRVCGLVCFWVYVLNWGGVNAVCLRCIWVFGALLTVSLVGGWLFVGCWFDGLLLAGFLGWFVLVAFVGFGLCYFL